MSQKYRSIEEKIDMIFGLNGTSTFPAEVLGGILNDIIKSLYKSLDEEQKHIARICMRIQEGSIPDKEIEFLQSKIKPLLSRHNGEYPEKSFNGGVMRLLWIMTFRNVPLDYDTMDTAIGAAESAGVDPDLIEGSINKHFKL